MPRQAVFFTHQFVRLLADFGNIIDFLHREGFAVTIYTLPSIETADLSSYSPATVGAYEDVLPPNVTVKHLPHAIPHRLGKMTPRIVARTVALAHRIARQQPDALYVLWGGSINAACGLPLRMLNRKCLFMVTGLGLVLGSTDPKIAKRVRYARLVLMNAYKYLLAGRNSRCLNHNAEDKAFLASSLKIDPDKFFVTPGCGVDPDAFPFFAVQADNPRKLIVVPGRLIEEKGIRDAVAASRLLHGRGVDHEMWFTGVVEPYTQYSRTTGREGSSALTQADVDQLQAESPCVKFVGYKMSLVAMYEQCDIVCLPSRYPEGVPTVMIEAAACGRAAVTCDTVGCREIVLNEETGLVVPQRDPIALAHALERLIEDASLRERFRQKAYRHFLSNYTKKAALDRTVEAFESLGFEFSDQRTSQEIRPLVPA